MRFEIEDVSIIYPNEEDIVDRTLVIEDDISCLSLNFVGDTDERVGAMFLNKDQVILLRDTLNSIIKYKKIE